VLLWPAKPEMRFMESQSQPSNLFQLEKWLATIGVVPATAWRWRRKGWIETVNIAGRVYISRQEIERFEARAAAGEFSQAHKAPCREKVPA